jgi:lipoprotein signal peptidase
MNVFELMTFLAIPAGAFVGYHFVSPFGVAFGIIAALIGAVAGLYMGPLLGLLFILPFEGLSRLYRFLTTGRWTDPQFTPEPPSTPNDRIG